MTVYALYAALRVYNCFKTTNAVAMVSLYYTHNTMYTSDEVSPMKQVQWIAVDTFHVSIKQCTRL